jgi:hypothetical protein
LEELGEAEGGDGGSTEGIVDTPVRADGGTTDVYGREAMDSPSAGGDSGAGGDDTSGVLLLDPSNEEQEGPIKREPVVSPSSDKQEDPDAAPAANPVVNEASVPEKLADDVMLPPLWKRMLYRVFPSLEKSECPTAVLSCSQFV